MSRLFVYLFQTYTSKGVDFEQICAVLQRLDDVYYRIQ